MNDMPPFDPIYRESAMAMEAMSLEENVAWMETLLEILGLPVLAPDVSMDGVRW